METVRVSQRALALSATNDLTPSRWCTVRLTNRRVVRTFRNYRLADLRERPVGHPALERERAGRPKLAAEQVWVEKGVGELWIVAHLTYREDGERVVFLRPYGCRVVMRHMTESSLRTEFRVWEDAVRYREQLSVP